MQTDSNLSPKLHLAVVRLGLCFGLLMALNVVAPSAALAKPKTVQVSITAVVDFIVNYSADLCVPIAEGDTITGSYTYSLKASDTNDLPMVGDYRYNKSPGGINLSIGGATTGTDPANTNFLIELVNDYNGFDNFVLHSYNNLPLSCGTPVEHISWQLDDPTMTALSNTDLLSGPPSLTAFSGQHFDIVFGGPDNPDAPYAALLRAHVTEAKQLPKK